MDRNQLLALSIQAAKPYVILPPRVRGGGFQGGFAGTRAGQSVDFHDYRHYQPGDDLRRVDWRAYARSGQMQLRLFREEVSPVVEIHLDTAVGMAAYSGKLDTVLFLAAFLYCVILASEGRPVLCRDGRRFSGRDFLPALTATDFTGKSAVPRPLAAGPARPIRYVLSDFLYADGLSAGMERYATGSGQWLPVMVLARSEVQPPWRGFLRLTEVGRPDKALDRLVDDRAVAEYQARLIRHEEGVAAAARRHGAALFRLDAPDEPLTSDAMDAMVRRLVEERVVAPR